MIRTNAHCTMVILALIFSTWLGLHGSVAKERVSFVVPVSTIYPGQLISVSGLAEKNFFIKAEASGLYVLDPHQAQGKVARKTLLAGKPIALSALGEPALIKRGVPAVLVFSSGTLSIAAVGVPLENGSVGDFIKIRNSDSGIIVSGTVLADGRVQVGAQ